MMSKEKQEKNSGNEKSSKKDDKLNNNDIKENKEEKNCNCENKNHEHHHDHNHKHCDHDHENCNCGCEHDDEECTVHGFKDNEEFQKYEKAFIQLEDALIKVDKELEETKKKAEENERLAITFKKDLERYKERAKEQEENMKVLAVTNIADKLIPILDNFEQALKVSKDPNIMKGFEMIQGMLLNAVKSLGIVEIEAENQEFDPNLHNAVAKKKTKDKSKDNKIATVYQKGYKMAGEGGKVIRHSTVEIYLCD